MQDRTRASARLCRAEEEGQHVRPAVDRRDQQLFGRDGRRRQDRIGFGRLGANVGDRRGVEVDASEQVDQGLKLAIDQVARIHDPFPFCRRRPIRVAPRPVSRRRRPPGR
jgi:hypothetical protein